MQARAEENVKGGDICFFNGVQSLRRMNSVVRVVRGDIGDCHRASQENNTSPAPPPLASSPIWLMQYSHNFCFITRLSWFSVVTKCLRLGNL
jgi:hypothetical protein